MHLISSTKKASAKLAKSKRPQEGKTRRNGITLQLVR
jgi:hypothetical protein